jgi:primosomal protein N'
MNVGVEYLEQKMKDALPGACIVRVTGETLREKKNTPMRLRPGDPAIVIGTQALSRPYGLKARKLIMVEWEELMRVGGYRAGEKMFHVLSNLIDILMPEEVYVFMPRKKRVNFQDYLDVKGFYDAELEKRKYAQFPPYVRIFLLEIERENESAGVRLVEKIKATAEKYGIAQHITGPLVQKRKGYRWRMILKGNEEQLFEPLSALSNLAGVRVEVDPINI